MALQLNDTTAIIHRMSGLVSGSSPYTCCFWYQPTFAVIVPDYVTAFALINADYSEWVGLFGAHIGGVYDNYGLAVTGDPSTPTPTVVPLNALTHLAYTRSGTAHSFYRDGVLIGTATADASAEVYTKVMLGYDGSSKVDGPLRFAQWREWTAALTQPQIAAEMVSTTVVRTTGLFTSTPLTTNLLDTSGNGHHWAGVGNFEFVSLVLPTLGSAKVYNLTGSVMESGGAILCFVGPPWKTVEWRMVSGIGTLTPFTTYTNEFGQATCRFDSGPAPKRKQVVVGVAYVP